MCVLNGHTVSLSLNCLGFLVRHKEIHSMCIRNIPIIHVVIFLYCVCMFFLSDGTLTTSNVCQALASVKDWHRLGPYNGALLVPQAVCDDIRGKRPNKTEEEKKTEMLVYYLHTMPQASWEDIAGALYYREEVTALEAVKRFLHHTPGQLTQLHVSILSFMIVHVHIHVHVHA